MIDLYKNSSINRYNKKVKFWPDKNIDSAREEFVNCTAFSIILFFELKMSYHLYGNVINIVFVMNIDEMKENN